MIIQSSCLSNTYVNSHDDCGCKGARFCKLCECSARVQQLKFANTLDRYDIHKCYVYDAMKGCTFMDKRLHATSSLAEIQNSSFNNDSERLILSDLLLVHEFISEPEEALLMRHVDSAGWKPSQSGRRKQDYGPKVNFKKQKVKVDAFNGVPYYADMMLEKLDALFAKNRAEKFELFEMCNLEYTPDRSSCIEMHKDDAWIWGERLISVNLSSDTVITLEDEAFERLIFVHLPRRSLLVMSSAVRHEYNHGIFPHHIVGRRLVITMREAAKSFQIDGHDYEEYGAELSRRAKLRISSF